MTSSTSTSVLRIGPTRYVEEDDDDNDKGCSSRQLRMAISNHFGNQQQQQQQGGRQRKHEIGISNRYFIASVALLDLEEIAIMDTNMTDMKNEEKDRTEDGVILVFDDIVPSSDKEQAEITNRTRTSFDALDRIHDHAQDGGAGDLLRLCVGVVNNSNNKNHRTSVEEESLRRKQYKSTKDYEREYARRILWCLDRGYEYIEAVDLSDDGISAADHESRDKEGFARVVEAIAGTVWSSAVMNPKKQQQLVQSYRETRLEQQQQKKPQGDVDQQYQKEKDLAVDNVVDNGKGSHIYEPPDPTMLVQKPVEDVGFSTYEPPNTTDLVQLHQNAVDAEADKLREEKARKAILEQSNVRPPDSAGESVIAGEGNGKEHQRQHERREDREDQERLLENLEGAIQRAARIRDASRAGTMSDDERRKRAGNAAVLIMDLMNQIGFEDDDDDDDDDDVDNNH